MIIFYKLKNILTNKEYNKMIKYLEIIDLSEKGIVYDELKKSILKESSYQHNINIIFTL